MQTRSSYRTPAGVRHDGWVSSIRYRRSKRWTLGAVVVALLAVAGLVLVLVSVIQVGRSAAGSSNVGAMSVGDWTSVLSLLLAYVATVAPLVVWMIRKARTRPGTEDVVVVLRRLVRAQWAAEVAARKLRQPLRLRWRPAGGAVRVGVPAADYRGQLQSLDDSRPAASALADTFTAHPGRPLVILGEPGAGKTTLAVLLTFALTEPGRAEDPIPVLLAAAAWDPAQPVDAWMTQRILLDHPAMAKRVDELTTAITDRRVVPVLDGLDEMPAPWRARALDRIDEAAAAGLWIVLTCRTVEFQQSVDEAGPLPLAAVIDIDPIDVDDAATYLTERETAVSMRWQPVIDAMRADPRGPLATALSRPLMISLARRVYQRPATRPECLTTFTSMAAIQAHLLDQFLSEVYPTAHASYRARRWLAFLAHHSRDRIHDPNLEWWRLSRAVPRWLIATTTALVVLPSCLLPSLTVAYMAGGDLARTTYDLDLLVVLSLIALSTTAVLSRHSAAAAHGSPLAPHGRLWSAVLSGLVRDWATTAVVLATVVLATVLALTVGHVVVEHGANRAASAVIEWMEDVWDNGDGSDVLIGWIVVYTVILTIINVQIAGRRTVVRRRSPRLRDGPASLAAGFWVGIIFGTLTAAVALVLQDEDPITAIGLGSIIGGFLIVPVGLARWLTLVTDDDTTGSPSRLLRIERTWLVITAFGIGTSVCVLFSAFYWYEAGTAIGMAVGLATVILVAFGSGSPWPPYVIARTLLSASRRLPWRPMRFMRQAHAVGVLRMAGSAYQFRHDMLRKYLADRWQA
jgi:hypothetical protein